MEQLTRRRPTLVSKVRVDDDLLQLSREPGTNRALFHYTANWAEPGLKYKFNQLCDVCQKFIPIYKRMIARSPLKLVHFEDDESCYDTLVRR